MTVSAFTTAPGCTTIRSTRPSVAAGIQRMSSGTSVPRPRTWRTIGPRFTVSSQTVARSTVGAAGFRRDKADGDEGNHDEADGPDDDPSNLLVPGDAGGSLNIHAR